MQKITPFLWFDHQAEEAMNFYVSIFKNSKPGNITRYGNGAPLPEGTAMTVRFQLDGQEFAALNGGPQFAFTPAISFVINCADQEEVDYYWEKLLEGGRPNRCGWLEDKFGLSWQVVPTALPKLLSGPDAAASQRAMTAMLQMDKIIIKDLEKAYYQ